MQSLLHVFERFRMLWDGKSLRIISVISFGSAVIDAMFAQSRDVERVRKAEKWLRPGRVPSVIPYLSAILSCIWMDGDGEGIMWKR